MSQKIAHILLDCIGMTSKCETKAETALIDERCFLCISI
jgi:hypothetical protein